MIQDVTIHRDKSGNAITYREVKGRSIRAEIGIVNLFVAEGVTVARFTIEHTPIVLPDFSDVYGVPPVHVASYPLTVYINQSALTGATDVELPALMVQHRTENHSAKCNEYAHKRNLNTAIYLASYPRYCRNCTGTGVIRESNYPHAPNETYPCIECRWSPKLKCPRCGIENAMSSAGEGPCTFCCFDFKHEDLMPFEHECFCS